jgi:hypothetical protein
LGGGKTKGAMHLWQSKRKAFAGLQHGCLHALDIMLNDFVRNKRNSCLLVNAKIIEAEAREITHEKKITGSE